MLRQLAYDYGLDCTNCSVLATVRGLGQLSGLEDLSFGGCCVLPLLETIQLLTNLRKLNLQQTLIPYLYPLKSLHKLQKLDISYTQEIRDLSELGTLPNLRHLVAEGVLWASGWKGIPVRDVNMWESDSEE